MTEAQAAELIYLTRFVVVLLSLLVGHQIFTLIGSRLRTSLISVR